MLRELSGETHDVVTGICMVHLESSRHSLFHDVTRVKFKNLAEERIEEYVNSVKVLDKAGSYGIQERGEMLVETIEGSFSNVVGLPVERLGMELAAWGVPYKRRSL
jgi:septum formation protein